MKAAQQIKDIPRSPALHGQSGENLWDRSHTCWCVLCYRIWTVSWKLGGPQRSLTKVNGVILCRQDSGIKFWITATAEEPEKKRYAPEMCMRQNCQNLLSGFVRGIREGQEPRMMNEFYVSLGDWVGGSNFLQTRDHGKRCSKEDKGRENGSSSEGPWCQGRLNSF